MTEPENFEEDLFADLYDDDTPAKPAAAQQPAPPPAPVAVPQPSNPSAKEDGLSAPQFSPVVREFLWLASAARPQQSFWLRLEPEILGLFTKAPMLMEPKPCTSLL
ncbi:hypothetical protein CSPX01_06882 [Colletotrichum filicis]|nr:hypothetical protein CSPX01_06882 [Colletotrichum filicis]